MNKNFPYVDPFFYDYGETVFNQSKQLRGTFTIKNMTLTGGKTLKYDRIQAKFNETFLIMKINSTVPKVTASGWLKSELSILQFPFNIKAKFEIIAEDIIAYFIVIGAFDDKSQRFVSKSFDFIPTIQKIKFNIVGLGSDTSQLSENLSISKFNQESLIILSFLFD